MPQFIEEPTLKILGPGNWLLVSRLVYESDLAHKDGRLVSIIEVPAGAETDLASIPSIIPRWLLDPNGLSRLPAIVHDYLCRTGYQPRSMADRVFLEAMKLVGVRRWRRWSMYSAVRILTFFKTGR